MHAHVPQVCLSLLGTWSGEKGENWDPATATLLQVLVSIQSLILVPQPYFNEPGYERQMGTPEGDSQNAAYNAEVQKNTMKFAMIAQLKDADPAFKQVRVATRSITPRWRSIRFRLALRTYDAPPCGPSVRVVSQTKSRKIPTRKILPLVVVFVIVIRLSTRTFT